DGRSVHTDGSFERRERGVVDSLDGFCFVANLAEFEDGPRLARLGGVGDLVRRHRFTQLRVGRWGSFAITLLGKHLATTGQRAGRLPPASCRPRSLPPAR